MEFLKDFKKIFGDLSDYFFRQTSLIESENLEHKRDICFAGRQKFLKPNQKYCNAQFIFDGKNWNMKFVCRNCDYNFHNAVIPRPARNEGII